MKEMKNKTEKKPIIGVNNYVEHSMSILDRIHELIELKFDGRQSELAKRLGKRESEISKWLNGVQNFTIFTISKLEEAFGEQIITVRTEDLDNSAFVLVQLSSNTNHSRLDVSCDGDMIETITDYKTFETTKIQEIKNNNVLL